MSNQNDFQPLGFTLQHRHRHIVAIAFAYSGQHNPRSLENHFHGFWNAILNDLVDDLGPKIVVIPQFQLDVFNPKSGLTGDESFATTAQKDAKELTPDFSLALFHLVTRTTIGQPNPSVGLPDIFDDWPTMKVTKMNIPAIVELKRPPTRSTESLIVFAEDLQSVMDQAKKDLVYQGEHVFAKNSEAKQVILLACCGEWWMWTIATRDNINNWLLALSKMNFVGFSKNNTDSDGEGGGSEEDDDSDEALDEDDTFFPESSKASNVPPRNLPSRSARANITEGFFREPQSLRPSASDKVAYNYRKPAKREPQNQQSEDEEETNEEDETDEEVKAQKANFVRHVDAGDGMERVRDNVEDAIPPAGKFSGYILFGSETSAQHLFLVHRFLEEQS